MLYPAGIQIHAVPTGDGGLGCFGGEKGIISQQQEIPQIQISSKFPIISFPCDEWDLERETASPVDTVAGMKTLSKQTLW